MTDKPTQEFQREERYIVVKRKQLDEETEAELRRFLQIQSIPTVECVIVESDWPEYETVWKMIEDRVTGNTRTELRDLAEQALHVCLGHATKQDITRAVKRLRVMASAHLEGEA